MSKVLAKDKNDNPCYLLASDYSIRMSNYLNERYQIIEYTDISFINWQHFSNSPDSNYIAVFSVNIIDNSYLTNYADTVLQAAETAKAESYYRAADKHRFVVGRCALRLLLGVYSQQPPQEVQLVPGINKKPVVLNFPELHYSVSSSEEYCIITIARHETGIDIERVKPAFNYQDVLESSFSEPEIEYITTSPAGTAAFFQLWTRKEALVKATAKGIDDDFKKIPALTGTHCLDDTLLPGAGNWRVSSFAVADTYAAALCYPLDKAEKTVRFYRVNNFLPLLPS